MKRLVLPKKISWGNRDNMGLREQTRKRVPLRRTYRQSAAAFLVRPLHFRRMVESYFDLEKTLKILKAQATRRALSELIQIDVHRLITQIARSKTRLERKISNTLLLEKRRFQRKLRKLVDRTQNFL